MAKRTGSDVSLAVRLLIAALPAALAVFALWGIANEDDPGQVVAGWFLVAMSVAFVIIALGLNADPRGRAGTVGDFLLYGPATAFLLYLVVGGFAAPELVSDPGNYRGARTPLGALTFSILGSILVLAAIARLVFGAVRPRMRTRTRRRTPKRLRRPPRRTWLERTAGAGAEHPGWPALLDRVAGARAIAERPSTATSAADRTAAVAAELHRSDETAAELLLRVERAAAAGDTRAALARLLEERDDDLVEARFRTRWPRASAARAADGRTAVGRAAAESDRVDVPALVLMLVALVGAVLTLPARRGDGFILELADAALVAGVAGAVSGLAFAALLWRRGRVDLSLAGIAGIATAVGLLSTALRTAWGTGFVRSESALGLGLVLQGLAVLCFVLLCLIAARLASRRAPAAAPTETVSAVKSIDTQLVERMRGVAESQNPGERAATRTAVVAGLGALYERGQLLPAEAEWALGEAVRDSRE